MFLSGIMCQKYPNESNVDNFFVEFGRGGVLRGFVHVHEITWLPSCNNINSDDIQWSKTFNT